MKKEVRDYFKITKGIIKSESKKESCQKCVYHDRQKVCQLHLIKTYNNENCNQFNKKIVAVLFRGGGVSPR